MNCFFLNMWGHILNLMLKYTVSLTLKYTVNLMLKYTVNLNIDVHCKPVGVEPGLWGDVREGPHARAGHRQDTSSSLQFIAVHDSSWQFISVHDSSWQFMTVHDSSLYFIIMCENSRWSLTTYCSSSYIPWQFMTFHGNIRLTKAILDKKNRLNTAILDDPWQYMYSIALHSNP